MKINFIKTGFLLLLTLLTINLSAQKMDKNQQKDEMMKMKQRFETLQQQTKREINDLNENLKQKDLMEEERDFLNNIVLIKKDIEAACARGIKESNKNADFNVMREIMSEINMKEQSLGIYYRSLEKAHEMRRFKRLMDDNPENEELELAIEEMMQVYDVFIELENEKMELNNKFNDAENKLREARESLQQFESGKKSEK